MTSTGIDARDTLSVGGKKYLYYSLPKAEKAGAGDLSRLPYSLKVLLENLLRHLDGTTVTGDSIRALTAGRPEEIAFRPGRVLMQDLLAGAAMADLAAMRDAVKAAGGDPAAVNPLIPVDLVIDHSLTIEAFASADAERKNVEIEYKRNRERYEFFRWCQAAFDNFRVVPPGAGIVHQVNIEYLADVVTTRRHGKDMVAFPDTVVGIDSHTPMVNSLGVVGWGVGGIEAQAAMLGQPISMLVPPVVGVELTGIMPEGATATDLVLTIAQRLRQHGVVGKFVEFHGAGLDALALADRATISNMAPEYGATCVYFPIDAVTLDYLRFTGRDASRVALVEAYAKAQTLWRDASTATPDFSERLSVDLGAVEPSLAGPRRPQDRVALGAVAESFKRDLPKLFGVKDTEKRGVAVAGMDHTLDDGDVVIAAITSCTNTSNPSVMLAAGLLAQKAAAKGLKAKPWVKTSLAPGSQVVTDYLDAAGLTPALDALGFQLVGYGCTTCGGFSGPLPGPVSDAVDAGNLVGAAVLSGNRNFEGRIHPQVRAGYLASPPLVVAYAIAGTVTHDLTSEPLGEDESGEPVYLRDIWPSNAEIAAAVSTTVNPEMFRKRYGAVFDGDAEWKALAAPEGALYRWSASSTYLRRPPYFDGIGKAAPAAHDLSGARALAVLGDSITTDHISPSGAIKPDSPAGTWLTERQVARFDFNSYGARRGNHEIMVRGGFANIRLRNELASGTEGGWTKHMPSGDVMTIFDAAECYRADGVPLLIFGGKEYGSGSSRDWAAKATALLGVRAVIAESFERIHRSNLIGLGVLPLQFAEGGNRGALRLDGSETIAVEGIAAGLAPRAQLTLRITRADGSTAVLPLLCRLDTAGEVEYYRHGGVLPFVYRQLLAA
ncbi:MAG: aconitate hydratase AcnA [Alphaproteobacteria bacterium]|nr:aconitate hydratase AcnA [Alphaproteobacteria bacterium]